MENLDNYALVTQYNQVFDPCYRCARLSSYTGVRPQCELVSHDKEKPSTGELSGPHKFSRNGLFETGTYGPCGTPK
ncbi:MAG: hypothetical protein LZF62_340219 [Nitrospira sp.]|nr:MAG: hypothetical protein LZF62_340219 [Nitrospira sp.]